MAVEYIKLCCWSAVVCKRGKRGENRIMTLLSRDLFSILFRLHF